MAFILTRPCAADSESSSSTETDVEEEEKEENSAAGREKGSGKYKRHECSFLLTHRAVDDA